MATHTEHGAYPSPELVACPYPFLDAVRSEQPVYRVPGRDEFLVTRHEDIVYVAKHPELFSSDVEARLQMERKTAPGLGKTDPPEHKRRRELPGRLFSPGRLRGFEPRVVELADGLIDTFPERGPVDFVTAFADLFPMEVVVDLLGLPVEHIDRYLEWATIEGMGIKYYPPERQEAGRRKQHALNEYMRATVIEFAEQPRPGALSELIQAQIERDGSLDVDVAVSDGGILLVGGSVTTSHLIASAMLLLLRSPEQLDRLRAEPGRIPAFVEESLRCESPVQWQPRVAKVDTELGGVQIPAGSPVLMVLASGNRDEDVFADAERFDIDRANARDHLAFSHGLHFCLGAPLARLEGRVAFERLLARLEGLRLPADLSDPAPIDNVTFRGPAELPIEYDRILPA